MATGSNTQAPAQAEIVTFETFLRRRDEREQFFQRNAAWINSYPAGVDGLWADQKSAKIISLV